MVERLSGVVGSVCVCSLGSVSSSAIRLTTTSGVEQIAMIRKSPVFNSRFCLFKVSWSTNFDKKFICTYILYIFRIYCVSMDTMTVALMKPYESRLFAVIRNFILKS